MTPKCCGLDASWTVISPSLQYWYCKECKKEVGGKNSNSSDDALIRAQMADSDEEAMRILEDFAKQLDSGKLYIQTVIDNAYRSQQELVAKATFGGHNASPFRVATRQDLKQLEETEPCWKPGCRCHEE